MMWLDAPTHDGFWWLRNEFGTEPVKVTLRPWDAPHFTVSFIGVDGEECTRDGAPGITGPGARWCPIAPLADDARAPDPTERGGPGERATRLG